MTIDSFDNPLDARGVGDNMPPSAIDDAIAAYKALSDFLARVPAITDEEAAREAKLYADRTKATLKDLDAAREKEATPLYDAWKAVNARFKPAADSLKKLADELAARLTAYAKAEKAKREAAAAEAARIAAEAERAAREAEEAERAAIENAKVGEFTDVGAATAVADEKFNEFERASRFAKRAEKETKVRIGGGFDRALSLRTVKTLRLDDANEAIKTMGVNDKIRDAILSSARDWRKARGELPAGVTEIEEERI